MLDHMLMVYGIELLIKKLKFQPTRLWPNKINKFLMKFYLHATSLSLKV